VAHDRQEVDPEAATLESGRLFDGWWSFRRDDALHEVIRLRGLLADRLTSQTASAVDRVLERARDLPSTPGETRVEASVRLLVDRAERRYRRTRALRRRIAENSVDGGAEHAARLWTELAMRRWAGAEGTTASGTLPVALIGVRTVEPAELPQQWERRGAVRKTQSVVAAVTSVLRPADRAVRLAEDEFLLIMPALSEKDAVAVAYRVAEQLASLAQRYPFVPVSAHSVVTVTRRRPLPVEEIRSGLDWAIREQVAVATLPPEAADAPADAAPVSGGAE
ncbi:MAG TPA: histidine kinase, partial [Micromonospora sp.]